jgi:hypothetical protein
MTDRDTIRETPWCPGCGLYYATRGRQHRNDCNATVEQRERIRQ